MYPHQSRTDGRTDGRDGTPVDGVHRVAQSDTDSTAYALPHSPACPSEPMLLAAGILASVRFIRPVSVFRPTQSGSSAHRQHVQTIATAQAGCGSRAKGVKPLCPPSLSTETRYSLVWLVAELYSRNCPGAVKAAAPSSQRRSSHRRRSLQPSACGDRPCCSCRMDAYALLGVARTASTDQIRNAYREILAQIGTSQTCRTATGNSSRSW